MEPTFSLLNLTINDVNNLYEILDEYVGRLDEHNDRYDRLMIILMQLDGILMFAEESTQDELMEEAWVAQSYMNSTMSDHSDLQSSDVNIHQNVIEVNF